MPQLILGIGIGLLVGCAWYCVLNNLKMLQSSR
jgi:hypothetical protein